MNSREFLENWFKQEPLIFHPSIERECLFNFDTYKLNLVTPLKTVTTSKQCPDEYLASHVQKENILKTLSNVTSIYIASKADFELFDKEKKVEDGKRLYTEGSLFLAITNPLFYQKKIIQDAKCWLTSSELHLMNYIKYVYSTLAFQYFNKE